MRKPFTCYAVSRGRAIGVFDTWATCAASVRGCSSPEYRRLKRRYHVVARARVQPVRRETRRTSCMSWGRVLLPHAAGYLKQVCGRLDEQARQEHDSLSDALGWRTRAARALA